MTRRAFPSYFTAILVCLFGYWLAVSDLEFRSMWYDEWLSWNWSQMNPIAMTIDTAEQGGHPPTYYAFLWVWTRLTMTEQLSAMRSSSVLFGVMGIALTYRLALTWFKSETVALVAALVTASSSLYVYFMRELRMYTLMVLLVVLSWWAFERFVDRKRNGALLYGLSLALMAYTYYFTAFIALIQFGMLVAFWRDRFVRLLVVYAGVLLVLLPWVPSLLGQIQNDAQYAEYGLELPGVGLVGKGAASQATNWDSIRSFILRYTNGQPYVVIGLIAVGAVIGAAHYGKQAESRKWYVAALLWFFGTILLFFGGNLLTPLYNPRYLLMIVPALGMVVGLAFVELPMMYRYLFGFGLIVFGLLTYPAGFFGLRTPHDELLGTVAQNFQPDDKIWYNLDAGAEGSSLYDAPEYYLDVKYTNLTSDDFVWSASDELGDITTAPRIWDIRDIYTPVVDDIHEMMLDGRRVTERYRFGEYNVRLYEAPPQDETAIFDETFNLYANAQATTIQAGEPITVDLWFAVNDMPTLDYSLALHLRTEDGVTVHQLDTPLIYQNPFDSDDIRSTSQWQPEDTAYFIPVTFNIPPELAAGRYDVWLTVYHWQEALDGLPLHAVDEAAASGNFVRLFSVTVE